MGSFPADAASLRRELARLTRLNQQLQSDASRDAEAHIDAVTKLRDTVRSLERKLSDTKQESTHHSMRAKRVEQELEDRKAQMDQFMLRQKLYDTPIGAQNGVVVAGAKQLQEAMRVNSDVKRMEPRVGQDDDRRNTVVRVLQQRLRDTQEQCDEQTAEVQRLKTLVDRARLEISRRESDGERLYGLLLKREAGDGRAAQALEPLDSPGSASSSESPQTLVHVLNMQVADLHTEVAALKQKLSDERRSRSDGSFHHATLQQRVDTLKEQLAQQAAQQQAAEAAAAAEASGLTAAVAERGARIAELEGVVARLQATQASGTDAATAPPQQSSPVRSLDVAQLVSDKEVLQRQIEILGNEVLDAQRASSSQLRSLVESQEKINRLTKDNASLRERNDTLVLKLAAADDARDRLSHAVAASRPPVDTNTRGVQTDVTGALEEAPDTPPQVEGAEHLPHLLEEVARLQAALREISEARDDLEIKLDDCSNELRAAQQAAAGLKAENEELYTATKALQGEMSGQIVRAREGESNLNAEAQRAQQLEGDLRSVSAERDELTRSMLHASEDFRRMLKENDILSRQLQEAISHKEVAEADLHHGAARVAELEHVVQVKDEEVGELMHLYRQLCEELEAAKRRLSAADLEAQRCREEALNERRRVEENRSEAALVARREQQTVVDLNSANYEVESLNNLLLQAQREKHSMQRALDDAGRTVQAAESFADSKERELAESGRERALLANELEHTRAQVATAAHELKLMAGALSEEQKEVRRLSDLSTQFKKDAAQQHMSSETHRVAAEEMQAMSREHERQLLDLQHEVKQATKKSRELASSLKKAQDAFENSEAERKRAFLSERMLRESHATLAQKYDTAQVTMGVLDEEGTRYPRPGLAFAGVRTHCRYMSHTYTVGFSKPHGDQLQQQHRALQPRDANASMLSQPMRFATGIPGFGAPPTAQPFAQHLKPQVNVQHPFVPVGHPALDMPHAQPAHLPNPPMPADATAKTSRHIRKLNGTLPETLKLPPTAVFTDEGEWEETDPHRLAQRKKQLCFGKVTEGYKNYVAMVPKEERQEGNEWHPHTPRLNQVCSKRSWDCQVGRWRRSLHNWDNAPSAEEMRKAPEELRPSREYQPLLVMAAPPATAVKKKLVNLKYTIKGESICHLAVVALQTTYSAFLSKLEPKVGRVASLHYADQEGDVVEVDDDSSLRVYLELVSTATPSPKLCVETLAQSLQLISQALSQEQKYRLAESLAIDLVSVRPATPTQQRKPIPELMDLVTPTPEGETPAMDVYRAVMKTPETEKCAERRRLTFH